MFVKHALVADRFTIEAVFIETFMKEAFSHSCKVLVMFVKHALVADRFTIEAVLIEILLKEADRDSCKVL